MVDLGPTWFWPDTQPLVTQLVADLGSLISFSMIKAHYVPSAIPIAQQMESESVHNGARRLAGGMVALVNGLANQLPPESMRLGHVLTGLEDRGDHIWLKFRCGDHKVELAARNVVLALPPRLLEEHVHFEPELDGAICEAMRATETWMAAQAKVIISYDRALWRDNGQSGNAFVTHEQAVIGQIFDASDSTSTKAALGGFLALSPELRHPSVKGCPCLWAIKWVRSLVQNSNTAISFIKTGQPSPIHAVPWIAAHNSR